MAFVPGSSAIIELTRSGDGAGPVHLNANHITQMCLNPTGGTLVYHLGNEAGITATEKLEQAVKIWNNALQPPRRPT